MRLAGAGASARVTTVNSYTILDSVETLLNAGLSGKYFLLIMGEQNRGEGGKSEKQKIMYSRAKG